MGSQQPPNGRVAPGDVWLSDETRATGEPASDGVPTPRTPPAGAPGSAASTAADDADAVVSPSPSTAATSDTGDADTAPGAPPSGHAVPDDGEHDVSAIDSPMTNAPASGLPGTDPSVPEPAGTEPAGTGGASGFARSTEATDEEVALRFVRGEPTPGSSELAVADGVLLAGGRIAVALRAGPRVVFVRADLPAELAPLRGTVERALQADGLSALDSDTTLAQGPARERIGITAAHWDLWGHDLADVFAVLAGTTAGASPVTGEEPTATAGGVTAPPLAEPLPPESDVAASTAGGGRGWRSRPRLLVLAGLLVLALVGTAFAASSLRDTARRTAGVAGGQAEPSASPAAPAPLVDYRDPAGRFSLQYPQNWTPVETSDPDVALLLLGPGGGSMLVRLVPLGAPIDPTKLDDVKAVTDVIVQSPTVQIVEQKSVELSGTAGYFYLYTFQDTSTQQEGVHSHFFLFRDRSMHTLVFQALPTEAFENLAADFDRISQSYRIL